LFCERVCGVFLAAEKRRMTQNDVTAVCAGIRGTAGQKP